MQIWQGDVYVKAGKSAESQKPNFMLIYLWWNQTHVNFLMESRIDKTLNRKLDKEKQKQTVRTEICPDFADFWDYKSVRLSEKLFRQDLLVLFFFLCIKCFHMVLVCLQIFYSLFLYLFLIHKKKPGNST